MSIVSVHTRRVLLTLLTCAVAGVVGPSVSRADDAKKPTTVKDLITFTASVSPDDLFSNDNAPGATPKFKRGATFYLTITGKPKAGYHTYPLSQRTEKQSGGNSTLTFGASDSFTPQGTVAETDAELVDEGPEFGLNFEYKKPFYWTQEILVKPDAKAGVQNLTAHIRLQVCNDERCTPGNYNLDIPITILDSPPLPALTAPDNKPAPPPADKKPAESFAAVFLDSLLFIGLAALAGLISLFTPCVFPMIPITVSFFLKQSEKNRQSPLGTALVYSGTIVGVLTVGGLVLMTSLQWLSQHWATNLVLGALFIFFALSLLGMYEIALPSFIVNYLSSKQQGQLGVLATVFMALTFTVVSFTCVAPFYGGFAASVASAPSTGVYVKLFFAALSYSVTFALPFFILALFPSLLRALPKSGGWMNTIKVVMGFLELAAAFGFLRSAEIVWTHVQPKILTFDVVLGIYIALAITCGLYLLNVFRLPHDYEPLQMLSVPRLLFALAFLALGLYLMPALFKQPNGAAQRPSGVVFEWIESFLLADAAQPTAAADGNTPKESGSLVWLANLDDGVRQARQEHKRVFIDFTGVTCKNCRINENTVFTQAEVRDLMRQYVLVQLYTDTIPAHVKNSRSAAENFQLEYEAFHDEQLPLYVIVEPAGDSFQMLEKYPEGKINNVDGFKAFLRKYLPVK